MKNIDKKSIINRMKSDAILIAKTFEANETDDLFQKLQDVNVNQVNAKKNSNQYNKYFFRRYTLLLAGAAALVLVFMNFIEPKSSFNPDAKSILVQNSDLSNTQNSTSKVNADVLVAEKQALKQDLLYMTQVFSL